MKILAMMIAAAAIAVRPLVDEDVLEPSVQNEVEHALSRARISTDVVAVESCLSMTNSILCTNGLTRTQLAVRLVSMQRSDGRWVDGTNDVTSLAVRILSSL